MPGATYTDASGAVNAYLTPMPSAVLASGQVTIPVLSIGNARHPNVIVMLGDIVDGPSGSAASSVGASYDPASIQMTLPAATVGARIYYNVVFTVGSLVSIGGVMGVDAYSGGQLPIPSVQLTDGSAYHDVVITVDKILSPGGGMPRSVRDSYDPASNQLTLAAIQLGNTVYTNAVVTVASRISVGGSGP